MYQDVRALMLTGKYTVHQVISGTVISFKVNLQILYTREDDCAGSVGLSWQDNNNVRGRLYSGFAVGYHTDPFD